MAGEEVGGYRLGLSEYAAAVYASGLKKHCEAGGQVDWRFDPAAECLQYRAHGSEAWTTSDHVNVAVVAAQYRDMTELADVEQPGPSKSKRVKVEKLEESEYELSE